MQATPLAQALYNSFAARPTTPPPFIAANRVKQQATNKINELAVEVAHFQINREALTSGEPLTTAERNDIFRQNREMLADLWHGRNLGVALARVEMMVQQFKLLVSLHLDFGKFPATWLILNNAVDCINSFNNQKKIGDYKANHHALRDLELLIDVFDTWLKSVSADSVNAVAAYNDGLQICYYFNRLMCFSADEVAAAFRVIRGASLESTAVKHGLKASKLREQTLFVGQILYRLVMVSDDYAHIEPAHSIPELRAKAYAQLTDLTTLKKLADQARARDCALFESKYGLHYFDWDTYIHEVSKGYVQISLKLK